MPQDIDPVRVEQCLNDLRHKARTYRDAKQPTARKAARTALHEAVAHTVQAGARQVQVARASGLSTAQVSRLARGASSGRTPLPPAVHLVDAIPAEDVAARYRSGESTEQIGQTYGCSGTTVITVLKRNGVPRRVANHIQLPVSDEDLARRYLDDRAELQQLASELGVTSNLISRRLAAVGVVVPVGHRRMDLPDAEIVQRYKRREPVQRIAKEYGVSTPTIMRRIREAGAWERRRARALTDEQKQDAVRLYQAGLNPHAVASQLGVSRTTVRKAIDEADVKRAAPGRRAPA